MRISRIFLLSACLLFSTTLVHAQEDSKNTLDQIAGKLAS